MARDVFELRAKTVCVVGLGYVGLPLANAFSKHLRVIGFDIDNKKIDKLIKDNIKNIEITNDPSRIMESDFVLICVPTPVTKSKVPDLTFVESAAEIVGKNLKKGALVVLESTVYPGTTEEILKPILERTSGLKCGSDFKIGYSPERMNPGDNLHTLENTTKIVAGIDEDARNILTKLYELITNVYATRDIKTAEAAKVIENIQRDLNIALINELAIIFHMIGLDTEEVLEAAATKWNFIKFTPGLVGGHCIPVDPYYLVYKANQVGYHPRVILSGRATNDYMAKYIAEMAIKGINKREKPIKGSRILILGLTYKENVPDIRESPVRDIVKELKEYDAIIYGYDPLLNRSIVESFDLIPLDNLDIIADCVVVAVAHEEFKRMSVDDLVKISGPNPILIDVKGIFKKEELEDAGFYYNKL